MKVAFQLLISSQGIAELKFDLPDEKINKFSPEVLKELEEHLDQLAPNPSIKALKFTSGKEDIFIAGADLHSFESAFDQPSLAKEIIENGHRVMDKIQNLPFPTIAVINGACLGGGLEFALSCQYRIVTDNPKTKLGLPEVTLGIIPGWGGTQRLPRLIGLQEALGMILTGKDVPGAKAFKLHLADAIFPTEFLASRSDEFIQQILTKEGKKKVLQRRNQKGVFNTLLEDNPVGRSLVFWKARKSLQERVKGHYPAPLIALNLIEKSYPLPLKEGLQMEVETFSHNIQEGFKLAPYLIGLFFTQEAAKKETGVSKDIQPNEIKMSAVIGAGTMGAGIAWIFADHLIPVRMKDISWDIIGKGIGVAKSLFDKGVKARKVTKTQCERRFALLSGTIDYSGFQRADIVVEAATENLELKKKIFQEIESQVKPDTIIASNTSSLTIDEMCEGMKHPERFIGMHFFNPVQKMPLVEVVPGKQTSPQTIATTVALCKKLGKVPMVVGDCHGFLVNRIFILGANEVMRMLEEGYSMESIKKELLNFGMPMEPFSLADEVGIDVTYKVSKTLEKAYGERMAPPKILELMFNQELYGKKNQKGFYLYKGKEAKQNPRIDELLKELPKKTGSIEEKDIVPRFIYLMVNEAARCLEEKVISRADFLDLCLIMGMGFPPFQGGLLRYADKIGLQNIFNELKRFEKEHGSRFAVSKYLEEKAERNESFY